ncbi:MAG: hypothetical protein QUV05_12260 [Phycisphaerae bacterium]|nr:hypothetical protein [Phycisphaerae bacterium]
MPRKARPCENKAQKEEILNQIRISAEDWIESVDLPKPDHANKALTLQAYSDFFLKLTEYENLFQRATGFIVWCKGCVLLQLKPLDKGEKGICEHGEWATFLEEVGLGETSAYFYRLCAKHFSRHQALQLGYQGMREELYPTDEEMPFKEVESSEDVASTKPVRPPAKAAHIKAETLLPLLDKTRTTVKAIADGVPKLSDLYNGSPEKAVQLLGQALTSAEALEQDAHRTVRGLKSQIKAVNRLLKKEQQNHAQ